MKSTKRKVFEVFLGIVAALVCLTSVVGAGFSWWAESKVETLQVDDLLTPVGETTAPVPSPTPSSSGPSALPSPSPSPTETPLPVLSDSDYAPMNILVLGSDTREGQGGGFGDASEITGARSDTTILVHINEGHTKAVALSIPRDLWINVPACNGRSESEGRFNEAFSRGGVRCTVKAVKSLTGLPINHVVVVDFKGFKEMVDAAGGLRVCLASRMVDDKAGLNLKKGEQTLTGKEALALARARYEIGDGSDISRISRQQQLVSVFVDQIVADGVLDDPARLYGLVSASLDSLSVDDGLNGVDEMSRMLTSVSGMSSKDVEFVTWPWYLRSDRATVGSVDSELTKLLGKITADDLPLKGKKNQKAGGSTGGPGASGLCSNPIG